MTASAGAARKPDESATLMLTHDNDLFAGSDEYYTGAFKATWVGRSLTLTDSNHLSGLAAWLVDRVPGVEREGYFHRPAFSFGQTIYTPEATNRRDLIVEDRPYAGWTYLSAALHSSNQRLFNSIELTLGVVGPLSLAEQTQTLMHQVTDNKVPMGWENQLENEPGLMLTGLRAWRAVRGDLGTSWAFDVIPHAGFTLGNVMTYANAGFEARLGYHLPNDFGTFLIAPGGGTAAPVDARDPRLSASPRTGITFFAGLDGRALARNIFLDGNTWQDSHSVDKNPFVADAYAGVCLTYGSWKFTYQHVLRTEEFEGQNSAQFYGSVGVAYTYGR